MIAAKRFHDKGPGIELEMTFKNVFVREGKTTKKRSRKPDNLCALDIAHSWLPILNFLIEDRNIITLADIAFISNIHLSSNQLH